MVAGAVLGESAISTVVDIAAVVTGQYYLYLAAAAIDAAEAGQAFSNGQDVQGLISLAEAVSAGISGATGGTVPLGTVSTAPLTTAQVTAQVINTAAQGVGGVYGVVQSAETGNGVGILAGALEAAAATAAGIGIYSGPGQTQQTLNLVSAALGGASVATNVASDFANGNLAQGLVDSLNLYLPAVAAAYQAWANGTGPTTQGATASTVPAQQISLALTQDGDQPLVALAVAESQLLGDPVPDGTPLAPQDVADLEAQLLLAAGSSDSVSALGLSLEGTVTADGAPSGAGAGIGNSLTITLPPDPDLGGPTLSIDEYFPNPGTIYITPGAGSQNFFPSTTITATPNGDIVTQGTSSPAGTGQSGSGGNNGSGSSAPSKGTGSGSTGAVTPDTATIDIGNLLSQSLMAFIPSAEAATPGTATSTTGQAAVPQVTTSQISPIALGTKPAVAFVGGFGDATSGIVQDDFNQYQLERPSDPSAYFSWTDGTKLANWIQQEDAAGYQVTVIAHSYGGDTAATVAANGSKVFNLVLLDPVSLARPSLSAMQANATNIYDYDATGGSALQQSNLIAGIGGAWNHYAAGVAQMYDVTNASHADIGSWNTVRKILGY